MLRNDAIVRLNSLIDEVASIPISGSQKEGNFAKWHSDCRIALRRIFGENSSNLSDFERVNYNPSSYTMGNAELAFRRAQESGLEQARAKLLSYIKEIEIFGLDGEDAAIDATGISSLAILENICLRFHSVARQLRNRREGRTTLDVCDEYDVQDLMHSLLRLHFDDIRVEEFSPSHAGSGSRLDFLLKDEGIVLEIKKTRKTLRDKQLGEELLVDIARYERHPDCKMLFCFVYDPEGLIGNPTGLERDLESTSGTLAVRVIVGPKS